METRIPAEPMPRGVVNAYWFQIFNATSWSLILGTPMLLYLKGLGASGTILGIAVALIPLFGVLQIPAASMAERTGYKAFVVRGWASRSVFILGIAVVTLLPDWLQPRHRIGLVLLMLTCFAAVRGISMCGYLPWITGIVPESLRGAFLSRDTMCMYLAVTATMLFSSFGVGRESSGYAFSVMFGVSYLAALGGVFFLRRIPDLPPVERKAGPTHPPWGAMLRYPPFARYVMFTVSFNAFTAALSVIWVPFMRDSYLAPQGLILGLSAYSCLIAAAISRLTGKVADRYGSRPLLGVSSGLVILGQCLWMSIAAGAIPHRTAILFVVTTFGATGFAILGVASTRLLMGLVPVMGRSHFFAISNVANSLTLGLMPVLWGLVFDGLGKVMDDGTRLVRGWTWNRYSLLYAAAVTGLLAAQFFRRRLNEPKAISTEEFMHILFIRSPVRLVARAMQPLRRYLPPG